MDEPPINLKGRAKRLRSLNEFEEPYWKGLVPWLRVEGPVPVWIVVIGFTAGVAIGIILLIAT